MNNSFEIICDKALKFRRDTLGYEDQEVIREYTKPAEKAGFCLFVLPLGRKFETDQEKGFLLTAREVDFIYINSSNYYCSQAHTLWHEMYHFIENHDDFEYDVKDKRSIEKEADQFAGCIQIPPPTLRKLLQKKIDSGRLFANEIHLLALYFNCHYHTMYMQIKNVFPDFHQTNKYFKNLYGKENDFKNISVEDKEAILNLRRTGNIYISPDVFEVIESNYRNKKIDTEMLNELIDLIKEVKKLDE